MTTSTTTVLVQACKLPQEEEEENDGNIDHNDDDRSQDLDGLTAEEDRLFTAISFGKLHRVAPLLPFLRSTEIRDDFGFTPLVHAAQNARAEHVNFLVKLFLQNGSDVNAQDNAGMTSLMHLIKSRSSPSAGGGAEGRGGGEDALRTVLRCRRCDPNLRDRNGNTALMYAAKVGNDEALAMLLFLPRVAVASEGRCRRVDVDARNKEGMTALDVAVSERRAACCRILVEEGNADSRAVRDAESFNKLLSEALSLL